MKRKSVVAAQDALERLRAKLAALEAASDPVAEADAWEEVLIFSQRVFHRLGHAKGAKEQAWWQRISDHRSNDPVMRYAHQARHANEHGIEGVSKKVRPVTEFGLRGNPLIVGRQRLPDIHIKAGEIVHYRPNDGMADITYGPEILRLVPVTNRGVTYDPPEQDHSLMTPLAIARVVTDYLTGVVGEAVAMIDD